MKTSSGELHKVVVSGNTCWRWVKRFLSLPLSVSHLQTKRIPAFGVKVASYVGAFWNVGCCICFMEWVSNKEFHIILTLCGQSVFLRHTKVFKDDKICQKVLIIDN